MTPPDEMPPGAGEAELVALRSGQTVGRYRIEAVLGQGGFGFTYLARDSRLGREAAIKEFAPSALAIRLGDSAIVPRSNKTADEFARGRRHFLNEGRILTGLRRAPGIVRVLDCFEANGTAYTVMELAVGTTLEERLKGGHHLSPVSLDRILWPLLEGLELVHSQGFFHGDIRPANIVLDANGKPTLVDFGTSRTGPVAAWTPNYAAPEQFSSAKQGPWTDIYGLAATLYRALTGHPPPAARERVPEDTCQPLTALRPAGVSAGMLTGIDKGLSLPVADRPQSIGEWRSILWQTGKFGGSPAPSEGMPANDDRVEINRRAEGRGIESPRVESPRFEHPVADERAVPRRAVPPVPFDEPPPEPAVADSAGFGIAPEAVAAMGAAPPRRRRALWVGLAASALVLGAATYFLFAIPSSEPTQAIASPVDSKAEALARQHAQMAEAAAARGRAEAEKRREAEAEQQRIAAAKQAAIEQAREEAHRKAEADAEAKRKAEAADPKRAQAAETALKLSYMDRMHAQVALAELGFDPKGTDGVFGSRSRKAIAAWQHSRNDPPTGFLTAAQQQALMTDGAAAIAKFDRQRKGGDAADDRSDDKAADTAFDGKYVGMVNAPTGDQSLSMYVFNGKGAGSWKIEGCGKATFSLSIAPDGSAALDLRSYTPHCEPIGRHYESRVESNNLLFTFGSEGDSSGGLTLTRKQN